MREKGKDTGSDPVGMKFEQACTIQPGRGTPPRIDVLIGLACEKKTIYVLTPAKSKWEVVELIETPKSK